MAKSIVVSCVLGLSAIASYGCAQVIGLDHTFEPGSSGAGGGDVSSSSSTSGSSSSSTSGSASSSASSGAGGGLGAGGSSGVGGSSQGTEIASWTAGAPLMKPGVPCAEVYTFALPAWLEFASPNPNERTSQISQNALCRGYLADVPRARNVGAGWGLNVETARANQIKNSDSWDAIGSGWSAGTMQATSAQADPAGGTSATLFFSDGVGAGSYSNFSSPLTSGQAASAWLKGVQGLAPYAHFHQYVMGPWVDVDSSVWERYSVVETGSMADGIALDTQDVPGGAGVIDKPHSVVAFGAQLETNAKYPSSYIPTGQSSVQRSAETLATALGSLSQLAPGGYYSISITFAPNFAVGPQINEMSDNEYDIIYFDQKNRVFLRKFDRTLAVRFDGGEAKSAPLTFNREQALTISVTSNPATGATLTIAGATDGNGQVMDGPVKPIDFLQNQRVYLLSRESGAGECSDLRSVTFVNP